MLTESITLALCVGKNFRDIVAKCRHRINHIHINEASTRQITAQTVARICEKGKTMSRYGDSDYDDMFYELDEFLKSHKPSELLKLVQEAVEWWEEKDDDNT